MRKIFKTVLILSAVTGMLSSCTLDLRQPGAIDTENAMSTLQDAQNLRRGLYVNFREAVAGGFISNSEVQSDLFQATSGFGNNYGSFYRWEFTPNDEPGVWRSCFGVIANANFFIENAENILNNPSEDFSDEDLAELRLYLGEAYFFRAYFHYEMVYRYCKPYSASTTNPETDYGVPYVTVYLPTANRDSYPPRGTLAATYENINNDLDIAEEYITTAGSVGSMWLTADAVAAFRARVYLNMGDYQSVINYAEPLVSSGRYPLINNSTDFTSMWVNDSGAECIMMLDASNESNNKPSSYDIMYISYQPATATYQPYFVPTQSVVNILQEYDNDLRSTQFLAQREISEPTGTGSVYTLNKFPGNPALFPEGTTGGQSNYLHKNKPFRIAEVYLNLAEAYAGLNQNANASNILNTLRSARISGYSPDYNDSQVMSEIKEERVRELIGEGFRLWDLKRWGDPVTRGEAQVASLMYDHSSMTGTVANADNIRFLWPIPQAEIDANPNISGEQNPGY